VTVDEIERTQNKTAGRLLCEIGGWALPAQLETMARSEIARLERKQRAQERTKP
jgi:hypothetical protein